MKLFYSPASPYVRKCMVVAHELGLAGRIEHLAAAANPVNRDPNIVRVNPLGKVPTLFTDDGAVLYARGVDDVDVDAFVLDRSVLGKDGDAAFLFQVIGIHDALDQLLVSGEGAGLAEQLVNQGGLAVVDVGNDGDVADWASGHWEGLKNQRRDSIIPCCAATSPAANSVFRRQRIGAGGAKRRGGSAQRLSVSSRPTASHWKFAMPLDHTLQKHHAPTCFRDRAAFAFVKFLRFFADVFFARRYGHRAVVLETVAAVPGMVGGTLQHLRALRRMESDRGWIRQLLDEAENERMHLMTFIEIARPSRLERVLIVLVQGTFYNFFFLLYLVSPETAHRIVGYLEEEAVYSYTEYLAGVDDGTYANVAAPRLALDYWKLPADARLRDVILVVRADEAEHRDLNHRFADTLTAQRN